MLPCGNESAKRQSGRRILGDNTGGGAVMLQLIRFCLVGSVFGFKLDCLSCRSTHTYNIYKSFQSQPTLFVTQNFDIWIVRSTDAFLIKFTHTHTHTHIYIYIYMYVYVYIVDNMFNTEFWLQIQLLPDRLEQICCIRQGVPAEFPKLLTSLYDRPNHAYTYPPFHLLCSMREQTSPETRYLWVKYTTVRTLEM